MPTKSDALKAWTDAHRVYADAAEVTLVYADAAEGHLDEAAARRARPRLRQGVGREAQLALNEYRIAEGERGN